MKSLALYYVAEPPACSTVYAIPMLLMCNVDQQADQRNKYSLQIHPLLQYDHSLSQPATRNATARSHTGHVQWHMCAKCLVHYLHTAVVLKGSRTLRLWSFQHPILGHQPSL